MTKLSLEKQIDDIITESLFHAGGTKSPKQALLELGATEDLEDFRYILGKYIIIVDGMNYVIHEKSIDKISEAKKYFKYITEKKIAYNKFFQYSINYGEYKEGLEEKMINSILKYDIEKLKKKKVNIDILIEIVKQNLKNYMNNNFIADTFNEIDEKIQYIA